MSEAPPRSERGQADPQRGRPRDPAIDRAIFEAADALIGEVGYAGVTVGDVAKRAGVPKSTIYRRFGSRGELLLAAARERSQHPRELPDTGSVRGDLIEFLRLQVETFDSGPGIAQLGMASVNDPELADVLQSLKNERRASTSRILQQGIERGELPADVDIDLVIDMLRGVGWTLYLEKRTLDDVEPEKVADYLLNGIATKGP